MFKLVLKDLRITVQPPLPAIAALWLFMLLNSRGKGFPFMVISLLLIFQPLLTDDKNKMENTYMSLPVKRADVVIARYIAGLTLMSANIILTFLGGLLLHILFPGSFKSIISIAGIIGPQVAVAFFMVLVYPIFFRFGAYLDAGMKVVAIVLTAVIFLSFGLIITLNHFNIDLFKIKNILLYMSLLAAASLFLSLLLSLRIYRRREF